MRRDGGRGRLARRTRPSRPTRPLAARAGRGGRDDERPRRGCGACWPGCGAWGFVSGLAGARRGRSWPRVVVWVVLGRAETPAQRARRERVRAELPHVVGLLAAAVRGGLPPSDGARPGLRRPARTGRRRAGGLPPRLALGVDPAEVWGSLEADPPSRRSAARWRVRAAPASRSPRLSTGSASSWPREAAPRPRTPPAGSASAPPYPSGCACCPPSCCSASCPSWPVWSGLPADDPRAHSPSTAGAPAPVVPRSGRRPRPVRDPADPWTRGTHRASSTDEETQMIRELSADVRGERGITTAEYAVGHRCRGRAWPGCSTSCSPAASATSC